MYEVDLQGVYGIPEKPKVMHPTLCISMEVIILYRQNQLRALDIIIYIVKNQSAFTARERMIVCVSKVPDISERKYHRSQKDRPCIVC